MSRLPLALRPLLRVTFAWNTWLALLIGLLTLAYSAMTAPQAAAGPALISRALALLELTLPLAVAIGCAHLWTVDREERTLELRFSYAPKRWFLLGERGLSAVVLLLLCTTASWVMLRATAPGLTLSAAFAAVIPPALALLTATMVCGIGTGNVWASAGGPLLWWGIALAVPRQTLGMGALSSLALRFHLLQTVRPIIGTDYATNRYLLVGLAIALVALTGLLLRHQSPNAG